MEWSLGLPPHKMFVQICPFSSNPANRQTDERHLESLPFQTASLTLTTTCQGQRHSQFGPNASNENCTMVRVLFRIKYYYNSRKYVTLTFNLDI